MVAKEVKIFYSYAHKDKRGRDRFENHLAGLKYRGRISEWCDQMIEPGMEWKREIEKQFQTADIILLLISHNFMSSDFCDSEEMLQALKRHQAGETRLIPILLSPVHVKGTPIANLQMLPRNGKAVTEHQNRDRAFQHIAAEIDQVVSGLLEGVDRVALDLLEKFRKQIFHIDGSDEEWVNNIITRVSTPPLLQSIIDTVGYEALLEEIKERTAHYEQPSDMAWINPARETVSDQSNIGNIIHTIELYRRQKDSFRWWFDLLAPALVYIFEMLSIHHLKLAQRVLRVVLDFREYDMIDDWETLSYEETKQTLQARIAYIHANGVLQRDPDNAKAYYVQCVSLIGQKKYNEALSAVEQAKRRDPHLTGIYDLECLILTRLGRFTDALNALEDATRLNPDEMANYEMAKVQLERLRKPGRWEQKVSVLIQECVVEPLNAPELWFFEPLLLPEIAESLAASRSSNASSPGQGDFDIATS